MKMLYKEGLLSVFLPVIVVCRDLTQEPGHLKPFGDGRPSQPVEEMIGAPSPDIFFGNYVKTLRPLKMSGAAKQTQAFYKWSDEYFLSLDEPENHTVSVETMKKERRDQDVDDMSFKKFVGIYNTTDHYMVNAVPHFISHDVMVPCPLQCKQLVEKNFVDNVMWFSSGGTKSVVHTDGVDNINCLIRGNKTLVMVDPSLYRDYVDIDHPEGSYSGVDVDKVDYTKYPGLAEVEFYHVHLVPGDCLYIPYLWIHQVRSFGSNLAVNIWWKHHLKEEINFDECNKKCDPDLTLKDAYFKGFQEEDFYDPEAARDFLLIFLNSKKKLDIGRLCRLLTELSLARVKKIGDPLYSSIKDIFTLCDLDKDGIITKEDITAHSDDNLVHIAKLMNKVQIYVDEMYEDNRSDEAEDEQELDEDQIQNENEDLEDSDQHDEL